jgi:hypothetical protein
MTGRDWEVMDDAQTLKAIQKLLDASDLSGLWSSRMLRRLAGLTDVSRTVAMKMIRARWGRACLPKALSRVVSEQREALLQGARAAQFNAASDNDDRARVRKKDPLMSAFGKRGGMVRGLRKGFAALDAAERTRIAKKGAEGRRRAAAEREAARVEREPGRAAVMAGGDLVGLPPAEAVGLLAEGWHLTGDAAARRLVREQGSTAVPGPAVDNGCAPPTVTIGRGRG